MEEPVDTDGDDQIVMKESQIAKSATNKQVAWY